MLGMTVGENQGTIPGVAPCRQVLPHVSAGRWHAETTDANAVFVGVDEEEKFRGGRIFDLR